METAYPVEREREKGFGAGGRGGGGGGWADMAVVNARVLRRQS